MADTSDPDGLGKIAQGSWTSDAPGTATTFSYSDSPMMGSGDRPTPGTDLGQQANDSGGTLPNRDGTMQGEEARDGSPSYNRDDSQRRDSGENSGSQAMDGGGGGGRNTTPIHSSAESTPRRSAYSKTPAGASNDRQGGLDLSGLDMKTSWDGSVTGKAGMLADPAKIAKEREREERVRQARERLAEERRKKLEELKEQQRLAQENREKQLEMRRKKIEDLRKRDTERRAAVEERRKMKEEIERARRESILQKAEERVARYEAWKAGGRKGMFNGGVSTPRQLSMSTSVLYHRSKPEYSSSNTLSPHRPESVQDRSKHRPGRKDSKDKAANKTKLDERDGDADVEKKEKKSRASTSFFDRLATPKFQQSPKDQVKEPTPKKDVPAIRVYFAGDKQTEERPNSELSPRKAFSTSNLANIRKKPSFKEKNVKDAAPKRTTTTTSKDSPASSPRVKPVAHSGAPPSASPRATPPPTGPTVPQSTAPSSAPPQQTPASAASDDGTATARSSGQDISAEAYKAKLAEKRRQAREKAEREAEEERVRQEELRLAEEERQRQEEEEQRQQEEEALRLAAEARKAEEERLHRAIEAEEKRKKEETERLEQERKAKEESDRKAKEEAERQEKEKQERARKAEEERQERKKKLEMIMKRVKTDTTQDSQSGSKMDSPTKSSFVSPPRSGISTPDEHEKPSGQLSEDNVDHVRNQLRTSESHTFTSDNSSSTVTITTSMSSSTVTEWNSTEGPKEKEEGGSPERSSTSPTPTTPSRQEDNNGQSKFRSPLLQQLVENKGEPASGDRLKFKSPLLQNLLGKTKVGARMGLSNSLTDLSAGKDAGTTSATSPTSPSSGSMKEIANQGKDEDKDEDTSLPNHHRGGGQDSLGAGPESFGEHGTIINGMKGRNGEDSEGTAMSPQEAKFPPSLMRDSALGSSIGPHQGEAESILANGHGHGDHSQDGMKDSSISLHSVDSETLPGSASVQDFGRNQTERESVPVSPHSGGGDGQFEELIDLLDSNGDKVAAARAGGTPIIAFEGNNRMTDVSESLS